MLFLASIVEDLKAVPLLSAAITVVMFAFVVDILMRCFSHFKRRPSIEEEFATKKEHGVLITRVDNVAASVTVHEANTRAELTDLKDWILSEHKEADKMKIDSAVRSEGRNKAMHERIDGLALSLAEVKGEIKHLAVATRDAATAATTAASAAHEAAKAASSLAMKGRA